VPKGLFDNVLNDPFSEGLKVGLYKITKELVRFGHDLAVHNLFEMRTTLPIAMCRGGQRSLGQEIADVLWERSPVGQGEGRESLANTLTKLDRHGGDDFPFDGLVETVLERGPHPCRELLHDGAKDVVLMDLDLDFHDATVASKSS
jgi:hypothetical protein